MPDTPTVLADKLRALAEAIAAADAILVGAGAGLSAAAGAAYDGEEFQKNFGDFIEKYHFPNMYIGGFGPFESPEELWAWWSRQIYLERYAWPKDETHQALLEILRGRNYFVLSTNVDHRFQIHGFDKNRVFYMQGDFGLFQCSVPCHDTTYDNEEIVRQMYEQQKDMRVPSDLLPVCPRCGSPMTTNLRVDNRFVQDEGWYAAQERYARFIERYAGTHIVFLELGVGANTPGIIKYPFWQMTEDNPRAVFASINLGEAIAPRCIADRSILIDADICSALETVRDDLAEIRS